MSPCIRIHKATLTFRSYRNKTPSLKDAVLGAFAGRQSEETARQVDVLKDIDLTLDGGDRLGVIGLNGAGKSTLLKMIVGVYIPQKGRIHVAGKLTPLIELGMGFDMELSGRENIYLNGSLMGRSFKRMRSLEQEIIDFSGLGDKIDLPMKYYSSGMYSRLAFSIGTVIEPEILLVDEIFAAGDAQFVDKARARMQSLFNHSKITMIVSHEMDHIRQFCNRAIVLHEGEIVARGAPDEMVDFYRRNIALAHHRHTHQVGSSSGVHAG